jgi:MFS transporter, FSR family, fosmidomycin resistance protein
MRYSARSPPVTYTAYPSLENPSADSFRRDARVIGLVGVAHSLSHFFQLALPPLFPLLRAEFDVSWTVLGTLVGVFYAASGLTQFAAGFVVDRVGARPVLLGGMALLAGGTMAVSLAPGIGWLFPLVALMGVGNGVFHPADFAILNSNVSTRRLGHAYSTHGIGGNLGYALAPIASFALGAVFGWRLALVAMGALGLVALGLLATQRAFLSSQRAADAATAGAAAGETPRAAGWRLFVQAPILMCFGYFMLQTMATTGVQTFAGNALNAGLGLPLAIANSAVTAYLLGSTAGILAGGFLAARVGRHDLVAASGLATGAALMVVVGAGAVSAATLLPLFAATGIAIGCTGPSRDLIVRHATPKGASGRIYGFVYSGLDTGGVFGPVVFGWMLDHAHPREIFLVMAALFVAAIVTVVNVRRVQTAGAN